MPPAKPLPRLVPTTSTTWPASNTSTVSSWPSVCSDASPVRISATYRRGVTPALAKCPACGLVALRGSIAPYATWIAE